MNITKTTVHSNPEGEGKLVSKKKKMLGRAKIELFNRNFYKSFCVERSIKRVSHNKSFRKCCIVFDLSSIRFIESEL